MIHVSLTTSHVPHLDHFEDFKEVFECKNHEHIWLNLTGCLVRLDFVP